MRGLTGKHVEQSLLNFLLYSVLLLLSGLHRGFMNGHINKVPDDHIHIAAVESHLGELSSLHLDERCLRKLSKSSGYLRFANTSWAFKKNVGWLEVLSHQRTG